MRKFLFPIAMVAAAAFAAVAFAQMAPTKTGDSTKGKVLTDGKGMTLYTFDNDTGGKSACNGPCAANWPPLMAAADAKAAGDYLIVTRDDGSKQWAYKSKPLYLWKNDKKPGDVTGDGFNNNTWHIAKP
jgi:predicted lipoprotein with Yx(FWY)xxD motif